MELRPGKSLLAAVALVASAGFGSVVAACPFCPPISLSLAEQVAQSDAVVLAQWVAGVEAKGKTPGSTTYEVLQVLKAPGGDVEKGTRITVSRFHTGVKGDLFVLFGTEGTTLEWDSQREVTETGFNYIAQVPSPEQPTQKRLAYFMKFLEFPDDLVADDAFGEFAAAPYKELLPLVKQLPRDRLRKWVANPEQVPVTRIGLYGMMLGLCGDAEDATLMEKRIFEPTEEFRIGIDGIMGGYLLLTGDKGLDKIDAKKLSKASESPFSETYAAMQAVRFMWTYGEGKISKDRLRQSMRGLLDRPELADLVVADLSRWKDWSVQDRLMEIYGLEDSNNSIKRAIVRYYLASIKDVPTGQNADPGHVKKGKQLLEKLREKDPALVQEAEQFTLLQ